MRLSGSSSSSEGRLEVRIEGQWGTVCDDVFDSNTNAATVVCKQLGLGYVSCFSIIICFTL